MAVELGVGYISIVPSARDFKQKLNAITKDVPTVQIQVVVDTRKMQAQLASAKNATINVTPNVSGFGEKIKAATSRTPATVDVAPNTSSFSSKLRSLVGDQTSLGRTMGETAGEGLTSSLTSAAKRAVAAVAAVFAGQQLLNVAKTAFSTAADFEQTEVAFKGLLGNADLAEQKLDELQKFAAATPFNFPQLSDAARKLLAFGFSAEEIIPTMEKLGNAAAALGASDTDINLVVRALGQISTKGRVQLEELNQIAEAFPGANPIPALAASVNKSVPEFTAALSLPGGALTAFGLTGEQAVKVILDGFTKINGAAGAMDRQSKTLKGSLSTLADTLRITAIQSLKPFLPGIADFILKTVVPAVEKLGARVPAVIHKVVESFKPLKGVFKALAVGFQIFRKELDSSTITGEGIKNLNDVFAHLGDIVSKVLDGFRIFRQTLDRDVKANPGIHNLNDVFAHLADAVQSVYDWLKDKIPKALENFNEATDKARAKLFDFFNFVADHEDAFKVITAGIVGFVGAIKTISSLGSIAGAVSGVLSLGPLGLVAGAIGGLGTAAFLAYQNFQPFRDAVDAVVSKFEAGGLPAALDEAGKRVGIFADSFDDMWTKVKPKLETFWSDVKTWFKDRVAKLFNFEVATSDPSIDFPGLDSAMSAAPSGSQEFDPVGASLVAPPPQPKQFKSFGEGFADALMNQVIPGVTKWIFDNQAKVVAAFNGLVAAFSKWAGENAPEMGKILWTAIVDATKEAVKQNPKLSLDFVLALGAGAGDFSANLEKLFDKLDEKTRPGGELDQKSGGFLKPGGGFDQLVVGYLDRLGRDTAGILDTIGKATATGLESVGRFTVGALEAIGRFTVDALDEIGHFTVDVLAEVGGAGGALIGATAGYLDDLGRDTAGALETIGRFTAGALEGIGRFTAGALEGIGKFTVEALDEVGRTTVDVGAELGTGLLTLGAVVVGFVAGLPALIADAAVGMWDGLYTAFKGSINLIIRAWNGLNLEIPEVDTHIPGIGKIGGFKLGGFHIDELAGGGVFTSKTTGLFSLAETPSARPEIVTPQKLLAQTFRKELASVGAGSGGGVQFGDIVVNGAQASPSSIADAVFAKAGWLHFTGRREL